MNKLSVSRLVMQAVVAALLGACAGGGGGGGGVAPEVFTPPPAPPAPPRPPPLPLPPLPPPAAPGAAPSTSSPEYLANWGLRGMRAAAAWQFENGHGQGVRIGVLDDGIDPAHPELAGRIDTVNSIDIVAGRNALTTTLSHGSELASLIAGNFNGAQTMGVAYEATILAVRMDNGSGQFNHSDMAAAINYAVAQGVDIINLSVGTSSQPPAILRDAVAAATAAGVIIVVSAGNNGPASGQPNYPGQWAAVPGVSNGLMLVAGGTNPDGSFNLVSNIAGASAQSYLVAPGWEIIVPDHGPAGPVPGYQTCGAPSPGAGLCRIQGTSYASPHVAGAAAVVMSAFPGLTPQQIVQVLLQSTDDMGEPGIDAVTGWGRLNLERAFAPIGTASAPLAMSAGAAVSISPGANLGMTGQAFGDGLSGASAAWTFASFDSFGRAFQTDFSGGWARAPGGLAHVADAPRLWRQEMSAQGMRMAFSLAESVAPDSYRLPVARADLEQPAMRIDADLAPGLSFSLAAHGARSIETRAGDASGHLDLVNSDLSLRLTRDVGAGVRLSYIAESGAAPSALGFAPVERSASATRASFDLGALGFDATLGHVREDQGVLGLVWSNRFGETPGGQTRFAGFGVRADLAGWRLGGEAEFGAAEMASGWLRVAEPLRTTAFALSATHAAGGGALTFSLRQPVRVESGALSFMAPTATRYGLQSLAYEERTFAPTPSGREMRAGMSYAYAAGDRLALYGEAVQVFEPGHVADAAPETLLRFGLRLAH